MGSGFGDVAGQLDTDRSTWLRNAILWCLREPGAKDAAASGSARRRCRPPTTRPTRPSARSSPATRPASRPARAPRDQAGVDRALRNAVKVEQSRENLRALAGLDPTTA